MKARLKSALLNGFFYIALTEKPVNQVGQRDNIPLTDAPNLLIVHRWIGGTDIVN
jgi:hypothetical protein